MSFFIIIVGAFKTFNVFASVVITLWVAKFFLPRNFPERTFQFPIISRKLAYSTIWSSIYNYPQYLRFKRSCHKSILTYLLVLTSWWHIFECEVLVWNKKMKVSWNRNNHFLLEQEKVNNCLRYQRICFYKKSFPIILAN